MPPDSLVAVYAERAGVLPPESDTHFRAEEHGAVTKLRQDHAAYAAMIRSTDESIGRIMDRIDELEIGDRTAIIFVSDNGGLSTLMRRSYNLATSNEPLRAGKGWLYEGGIRAPLIVKWPGVTEPGSTIAAPATSHDLYPTMLAMAGLPARPRQHVDGVDLTGAMDPDRTSPARDTLYWHFPHYHGSGNRPSAAIRAGDWKLVHWFEDGRSELFDLRADLSETTDLADVEAERAAGLVLALLGWLEGVGANLPTQMESEGSGR